MSTKTSRPALVPSIGLRLTRAARVLGQEFERSMAQAGGSVSAWQVLLLVRSREWATQSRMAEAIPGLRPGGGRHTMGAVLAQQAREERPTWPDPK